MEVNYPGGVPKLPSFNYQPWIKPAILLAVVGITVATMFYQIEKDEAGVVQRFGKYVRTTTPGLHIKLPFWIETVKHVSITSVFKEEFGFRTISRGGQTFIVGRDQENGSANQRTGFGGFQGQRTRQQGGNPYLAESLMLTGDLNVAVVEWVIQFKIKDPVAFSFRVKNQRETIRDMSQAMMRLVVGDHTSNDVLTTGREEIQQDVKEKLQELLDSYGAGISIRNVLLQNVKPPKQVEPSFNEVNEARQEKEKLINQAWQEYNRVIPRAKGQAEQTIRNAEGYAVERVNRSQGDAKRFLLSWEAYKSSPEVTKKRLYLETMHKVLPELKDKIFMDEDQRSILPLLNMNPATGKGE